MLLFYVRHGRPIYAPDSLTAAGARQAESVAKRLALYGVDRIFSSPSARAVETARPLAEIAGLEVEILDWAHESNAWKYASVQEADARGRWIYASEKYRMLFLGRELRSMGDRWLEHPELSKTRLKEGLEFAGRGIDSFLLSLGLAHDRERGLFRVLSTLPGRVALFAHEGMGKLFLSSLLDIPYFHIATAVEMSHTGVTAIEFAELAAGELYPRILTLSNDSHLYRDGLPTRYQDRIYF